MGEAGKAPSVLEARPGWGYIDANGIETIVAQQVAHLTCHPKKYVLGALAAKCFGWPLKKHENNEEN